MELNGTIKIGVFGGAFDPIHSEHVHLVKQAIEQLGLTRVLVVPSFHAPHKLTSTSYQDRVAMAELAFADVPEVEISLIESEIEGNTYSAVVLPKLAEKVGGFVHLVGGDSLLAIESWYRPQEVLRYPVAVFARGDQRDRLVEFAAHLEDKFGAQVMVLQSEGEPISSTDIRLSLAVGRRPQGLADSVYSYITAHGLYAPYARIVQDVSSRLDARRWAHTQEVALFAAKLAPKLGLPLDKVLPAALLHDCAKTADGGKQYEYLCKAIPSFCRQAAVLHAFQGALVAEEKYGITDPDVLNAIRYHTTGRAGMSDLERLIYLADYAEPTRTHEGSAEVRALSLADFEQGFRLAVDNTFRHIRNQADLCPLGEECHRFYIKQGEQND